MELTIRLETEKDRREVEELTRDAFWKEEYARESGLGCNEHYLAHILRHSPDFLPALDFVAVTADGRLAGNVMYTRGWVESPDGERHEVATFGPLSVRPEFQKRGVGSALMRHSLREAVRQGHGAVLFFGHPEYYPRFGFREAGEFGITTGDGKNFPAFMGMELVPGSLAGVTGRFVGSPVYDVDNAKAKEFDRQFPAK